MPTRSPDPRRTPQPTVRGRGKPRSAQPHPTPAAGTAPQPPKKGAVALAAQALAEASTQLRRALADELGGAGAEVTQKVAASLQDVAQSLDAVAAKVAPSSTRAQRTRADLLDAALQVFARRGYEGASVGEIAEAAGYTKGALYAHFASKELLFMALAEKYGAEAVAATAATDTGGKPFVDWYVECTAQTLEATPEIALVLLAGEFGAFGLRYPAYRDRMAEIDSAVLRAVAERIAADREPSPTTPPEPTRSDIVTAMGLLLVSNDLMVKHALGVPEVDTAAMTDLLRRVATP